MWNLLLFCSVIIPLLSALNALSSHWEFDSESSLQLPGCCPHFSEFPAIPHPRPPAVSSVLTHRQHPHTSEPLCLLFCLPGMFFPRYLLCFSPSYGLCKCHLLRETCLTTLPKVESPTLILYLLLLCYFPLSDFLVLDIIINIYSWPSVSWGFCIHGVGWIHGCETTGMEGRLTVTFSVRNLSICRFWYLWRSWNKPQVKTEGGLYFAFT